MDHLNSMFTRLKRGWYAGGDNQPPPKQQWKGSGCGSTSGAANADGAAEEEGFVLISQSECQQTTGFASTREDTPVQHNSAPYTMMSDQNAERTPRKDFTMFATCDPLFPDSSPTAESPNPDSPFHPAVLGVPFEINPKLLEKDRLQDALRRLDLETSVFDWQRYSYDFDFEQSSLRELSAMENNRKLWKDGGAGGGQVWWRSCT